MRFSMRTMMVTVVVAGVLCHAAILWHRHHDRTRWRDFHSGLAKFNHMTAKSGFSLAAEMEERVARDVVRLEAMKNRFGGRNDVKSLAETLETLNRSENQAAARLRKEAEGH